MDKILAIELSRRSDGGDTKWNQTHRSSGLLDDSLALRDRMAFSSGQVDTFGPGGPGLDSQFAAWLQGGSGREAMGAFDDAQRAAVRGSRSRPSQRPLRSSVNVNPALHARELEASAQNDRAPTAMSSPRELRRRAGAGDGRRAIEEGRARVEGDLLGFQVSLIVKYVVRKERRCAGANCQAPSAQRSALAEGRGRTFGGDSARRHRVLQTNGGTTA